MQTGSDQLVVRQHERLLCRVGALVSVAEPHLHIVKLARSVGDGSGGLSASVVDCSRGGLGLECTTLLPRSTRITIQVKSSGAGPPLEFTGRVQRVGMTDRKPTYYLGIAFVATAPDHAQRVEQLLGLARASASTPAPPSPATPSGSAPLAPRAAAPLPPRPPERKVV